MFIKKIFELLNKDLTGGTWESEASHEYFCEMTYFGFKHNNNGYWESEINVDGSTVSVIINSPTEDLPTDKHVSFIEAIICNPEKIQKKIKPLMFEVLENWKEIEIINPEALYVGFSLNIFVRSHQP